MGKDNQGDIIMEQNLGDNALNENDLWPKDKKRKSETLLEASDTRPSKRAKIEEVNKLIIDTDSEVINSENVGNLSDSSDSDHFSDISSETTSSQGSEEGVATIVCLKESLAKTIEKEKELQVVLTKCKNRQLEITKKINELEARDKNKAKLSKENENELNIANIAFSKNEDSANLAQDTQMITSKDEADEGDNENESDDGLYDDSRDLNFFKVELNADNITKEIEKALSEKPDANRLNLNMSNQNDQTLKQVIKFLEEHPQITHFSICDAGLKPDNIKTISDFLESSSIEILNISHNNIDLSSLKSLMSALCKDTCQVTSLELSGSKLDSNQISLIMEYLPRTKITHLDLGGNDLTSDDMNFLTESIKVLRGLDLAYNYIDDEGALIIQKLLNNSQMEYLELDGNELTDKGCELFGEHNVTYKVNVEDNPLE